MRRFMEGALAILVFSGCSGPDDWKASTYPTKGTITINGEVPVRAEIYLVSTNQLIDSRGSKPFAGVNPDGSFSMTTYKAYDGVPAGDYAVTIVWPMNPNAPSPDRLGGAYDSVEEAPAKVTIVKGQNVIPPIALKGVKIKAADDSINKLIP